MARKTVEVRKPRDIGDAIRAVREARGISQDELAQANAYDRFYLNGLESGRSTLYVTRLLRTLKSLGITLSVTFDPEQADRRRWLTGLRCACTASRSAGLLAAPGGSASSSNGSTGTRLALSR